MTHGQEEAKSLEMSDALRNSLKMLKGYIDRSSSVKGDRMSELQDQLDIHRYVLLGLNVLGIH